MERLAIARIVGGLGLLLAGCSRPVAMPEAAREAVDESRVSSSAGDDRGDGDDVVDRDGRDAGQSVKSPAGLRLADQRPFLLTEFNRSRGACIFFVGTDCPISNAYAPEIGRIIDEFSEKGIAFYLIYADRDLQPESAAEHAREFGFRCPAILDSRLELARALKATRMPEVVLLPPQGAAVYQGRIDDRYPAPGAKRREHPTTRDLRDALTAYLAGQPIAQPRTSAVGCYLDFPR
jgi:hypothetical protein